MAAAEADAAAATTSSPSAPSFTGTNVQVAGVDEADMVKTDGFYIYSLMDDRRRLRIVEVKDGAMNLQSTLDVGFEPREMLLYEDMLLLVASEYRVGAVTRIAQVDISDRGSPEVIADLSMDGVYNGSRLSDGVARVVITSNPVGIEWEHPRGSGLRAEQEAIEANRELVRNSTLGNWLPAYVQADLDGGDPEWGQLVDCSNVLAPGVFSGLNTLSIVMFDLSEGIGDWTADMHLIFTQNRPDVFAPGDAAVLFAMRDLYGLPADAPPAEYARVSDGWRPFRSIGVWYMYEHIHALREARRAGA